METNRPAALEPTATTAHGATTYRIFGSDRACNTRPAGPGRLMVTFGRIDTDWDGRPEFRVSHGKPSKSYGTAKGAKRAIDAWLCQ